jgi:hypothetical protein
VRAPARNICIAAVCLSRCAWIRPRPARLAASATTLLTPQELRW